MASKTFGSALGALIHARRKAKGLTQTQLAEDAFGTPGKTRRISELENGTVANPHPKTIDPIIALLEITEDEIEQCAKASNGKPDADLDRAYREARNLVEVVARQFENDNPNATLSDLDEFLRDKAHEWAQLRERIRKIDEADHKLGNLKASAEAALDQGRFDEVDALLIEAEDVQQHSRTLNEVRIQANLRILRADTSLLKGDDDRAVELYRSAAEFFMPFDKAEGVQLLQNLAHRLYETGRRSLAGTFHVGARLLETVLTDFVAEDRAVRSKTRYQLSLLYRNAAEGRRGPETLTFLTKAVDYAREGLSDLKEGDDPFDITAMKISLGNCLFEIVKLTKDDDALSEAKSMLKSARDQLLMQGAGPDLLACVHNSLGGATLEKLNYSDVEDEEAMLTEAIGSFQAAIVTAEECSYPEIWGVANHNLGNALAGLARLKDTKPEDRGFLRVRAVAAVSAAIETYPEARFPFHFAKAHASLARIFWDMAGTEQGEMIEPCLVRSIHSWTVAQHIYTKEQFPDQWAEIQMHIGAIYGAHAGIDGIETKHEDLLEAQRCLSEALEVFKERDMQTQIDYCSHSLKVVAKRLKDSDK